MLDKIRSETFTENLSEASRDISRMEYLRNDYYRREYENAAALDVKGTAEGYLEQFGFMVKQSSVELTENYEVRKIILTVAEKEARDTEGIFVEQGKAQGSQIVLDELKQKLVQYYGAVENINTVIADAVVGMDASDIYAIDAAMLKADGTKDKSNLGSVR